MPQLQHFLRAFDGFEVSADERIATIGLISTDRSFLDSLDDVEKYSIIAELEFYMLEAAESREAYLDQETFKPRCKKAIERFIDEVGGEEFSTSYLSTFLIFHRIVFKEHICGLCKPFLMRVWNARIFKDPKNILYKVMRHRACENPRCSVCHSFRMCALITKVGLELEQIRKIDYTNFSESQLEILRSGVASLLDVLNYAVRHVYYHLAGSDYETAKTMVGLAFLEEGSYREAYELAVIQLGECRWRAVDRLEIKQETAILPDKCNHVLRLEQFGPKCPVCSKSYLCARKVHRNIVVDLLLN